VVIAGDARDKQQVLKEISAHFSALTSGKKSTKKKVVDTQTKFREVVHFKKTDQTHLIFGVRAFSIFDKRKYALEVLSDVLGGSMSSRLFQRVRGELGAAYYVHSSADLFTDHGLLTVAAGVDHAKLERVLEVVGQECKRLTKEKVAKEELTKAKHHLVGHLYLSLESSDAWANFYGGQEVMGLPLITPREIAKHIESVTADDVRNVARAIVKWNRANLAVIGPFKNKSFSKVFTK
jgi:predicted Zn-dependent peptidase